MTSSAENLIRNRIFEACVLPGRDATMIAGTQEDDHIAQGGIWHRRTSITENYVVILFTLWSLWDSSQPRLSNRVHETSEQVTVHFAQHC